MKELILKPEQIIVPGEYELGNESILKIYFRIFERGHGKDLPPVLVVHYLKGDRLELYNISENEWIVNNYRENFEKIGF